MMDIESVRVFWDGEHVYALHDDIELGIVSVYRAEQGKTLRAVGDTDAGFPIDMPDEVWQAVYDATDGARGRPADLGEIPF